MSLALPLLTTQIALGALDSERGGEARADHGRDGLHRPQARLSSSSSEAIA